MCPSHDRVAVFPAGRGTDGMVSSLEKQWVRDWELDAFSPPKLIAVSPRMICLQSFSIVSRTPTAYTVQFGGTVEIGILLELELTGPSLELHEA